MGNAPQSGGESDQAEVQYGGAEEGEGLQMRPAALGFLEDHL